MPQNRNLKLKKSLEKLKNCKDGLMMILGDIVYDLMSDEWFVMVGDGMDCRTDEGFERYKNIMSFMKNR